MDLRTTRNVSKSAAEGPVQGALKSVKTDPEAKKFCRWEKPAICGAV